ncbi:hypothetical protein [Stigmatella aurantiaca]|uniref:Conserved uncharacterized protein n=1 Tax=Stigmatella aurantiaca (strain DW4/3-1) TaxID=378806 RepID=E3FH42_STIAD|nr:hypothetical protein [Stigmatella aurantiaca]ADO74072.1 conserved uncharacterized protein [Stigmatella aurantiaca DW4/3-1]
MSRPRLARLLALLLGTSGLGAGCDAVEELVPPPPGVSDRVCYRESDCAPNGCCGQGTNPTHVLDAPDCSGVRCSGECPANSIDCGRCVPTCRDSRCAAACG